MDKHVKLIKSDGKEVAGKIQRISKDEMPNKKDGWVFDWRTLSDLIGIDFFALITERGIEDMIALEKKSIEDGKFMMLMHWVEIAKRNRGDNGDFKGAAGCLFAFACLQSALVIDKDADYFGFLTFNSKTDCIETYKKYGATHFRSGKMWFDPDAGHQLIETYLRK